MEQYTPNDLYHYQRCVNRYHSHCKQFKVHYNLRAYSFLFICILSLIKKKKNLQDCKMGWLLPMGRHTEVYQIF